MMMDRRCHLHDLRQCGEEVLRDILFVVTQRRRHRELIRGL